jgi:hypothetical protein
MNKIIKKHKNNNQYKDNKYHKWDKMKMNIWLMKLLKKQTNNKINMINKQQTKMI